MLKIYFFPTGNTAVLDEKGQQMPQFQRSWLEISLNYLESRGLELENTELNLPGNRTFRPFRDEEGNWRWKK